jgi:predicted phage terminase large subunit-like protein
MQTIAPQPGPQSDFLSSTADIAIYGGAAGGGKSYALLLDPLRHYDNGKFAGVIFRRLSTHVRNPGGLWDESVNLYGKLGAKGWESRLEWKFPRGGTMKFGHLEYEKNVYDWQGSQVPFIGFDELTHFTEKQFWYMMSRNRSMSGIPGYVRATTNPDKRSWVRHLIDWWIGPDGFPIQERSGKIRWFIRMGEEIIWADHWNDLTTKYGTEVIPKSLTFIPAKLQDNRILTEKDPAYLGTLKALARVERERLLDGNWNVDYKSGNYFKRAWFPIVDQIPGGWNKVVRYWDRAATVPSESNPNPDYTAGVKLYGYPDGRCLLADVRRDRVTPLNVERLVKNTADYDGPLVRQIIEQEPGASGVADAQNYVRLLRGYDVKIFKPSRDKVTRALPVSAQAEHGNVMVLRAPWNEEFFNEAEAFPPEKNAEKDPSDTSAGHDDQIDGLSGGYNEMFEGTSMLDVLTNFEGALRG